MESIHNNHPNKAEEACLNFCKAMEKMIEHGRHILLKVVNTPINNT